jgi:Uma2 family endonuclease
MSVRTKLWTREEYDRLVALGAFPPDAHVQLIEGEIVEMTPQGAAHAAAIRMIEEALRSAFPVGYDVRVQLPLALLPDSEPEPDVAVVSGSFRDYLTHHPEAAVLVVEVADESLAHDRARKATVYARGRVPEYWILNLADRQLEVSRDPDPGNGSYRTAHIIRDGDEAAPLAAPAARIPVNALLP